MKDIRYLQHNPYENVKWGNEDRPVIIIDGTLYSLSDLKKQKIIGKRAYVVGSNNKNIALICSSITVELIHFYDMKRLTGFDVHFLCSGSHVHHPCL